MKRRQGKKFKPHIDNARAAALAVLTSVEAGAYSNLKLNHVLQQSRLSRADAALATEITYGTLQRLNTLDWMLSPFVRRDLSELDGWVRNLLRLSVYQLVYLDRIPDHAVVDEAVKLAKSWGHAGIGSFVNGTLRNFLRHPERRVIPDDLPLIQRWALEHSHPEWLVKRWLKQYGPERTEAMLRKNNCPPVQAIRVNRLKISRDELLEQLRQQLPGEVQPSPIASQGIRYVGTVPLAQSRWYQEGWLTVQDESAQLVSEIVAPEPGMRVLDACAAPGGKTTHLAEWMGDQGTVVAWDIYDHKVQLVQQAARRLGLSSITVKRQDARTAAQQETELFDAVLLDVPCSGLGVIRRRPEIKWQRQEDDISRLVHLQRELLAGVAPMVRPGGILVYSTCTLAQEENEENIAWFLDRHREFQLDRETPHPLCAEGMVQIFPDQYDSDGFFIARLKKQSSGSAGRVG